MKQCTTKTSWARLRNNHFEQDTIKRISARKGGNILYSSNFGILKHTQQNNITTAVFFNMPWVQ